MPAKSKRDMKVWSIRINKSMNFVRSVAVFKAVHLSLVSQNGFHRVDARS